MKLKRQLIVGIDQLKKELFNPVKHVIPFKPDGGLWSSTYTPNDKYKSDWLWYYFNAGHTFHDLSKALTFEFKKGIRVYTVDSYEALLELIRFVGKVEYFKVPFKTEMNMGINFIKASEFYDVIYLTFKGQFETKEIYKANLCTWDCECCYIMNFDAIDLKSSKPIDLVGFEREV